MGHFVSAEGAGIESVMLRSIVRIGGKWGVTGGRGKVRRPDHHHQLSGRPGRQRRQPQKQQTLRPFHTVYTLKRPAQVQTASGGAEIASAEWPTRTPSPPKKKTLHTLYTLKRPAQVQTQHQGGGRARIQNLIEVERR